MTDAERAATAHHEADHSVVGLVYGLSIVRVTVCEDADRVGAQGYCLESPEPLSRPEADVVCRGRADTIDLADLHRPLTSYLVYLLAGGIAEQHFTGRGTDGDWHDRLKAEDLLSQALRAPAWGRHVHQAERMLAAVSRRAVRKHWDWIANVADTLLDRGTLTGDECRALRMGRATKGVVDP